MNGSSAFGPSGAARLKGDARKSLRTDPWLAVVEFIQQADRILLICHVSPDGDAIGSLLGLGMGLCALGKQTTLACESSVPSKFNFLPNSDSIINALDTDAFDLVIGLDSSDVARLGSIYDADRLAGVPLVNMDHHVTNLRFGDVNLVDTRAASTAEVVLALLDRLGISLQGDGAAIATCLLTGIVTDTLGFRTSNVTPQVMRAAMRLMEAGASLSEVTHYAFHQRPLAELYMLACGLNRMQVEDGLAWSEIKLSDRCIAHQNSGYGGGKIGDADLVSVLVHTHEIHIAAVFTERENEQVETSFRADPGFDVAQLALALGGGGHPAASGCTLEGTLETVKARVLPMLRTALQTQRKGA
jgi:bifunctional oligoribonuclease and PAP phosphatase NrnA